MNMDTLTMTDADFRAAVFEQFEVVRALLAAPKIEFAPQTLSLSRKEAMLLAGYSPDEVSAWYKFCSRAKLKPYRREHYRRQDVVEAIARAAFPKRKTARKVA